MDIQEDIKKLDTGIRLLKVQYEQFFSGALGKQPLELRFQLEKIIRRYSNEPSLKLAERFHFNTLVERFNSLAGLWSKHVRAQEEGRPLPGQARVMAPSAEDRQPAASEAGVLFQQVIQGSDRESSDLRPFYEKYLEACEAAGRPINGISYSNFASQIQRKTEAVKTRTNCDAVRLRLTQDGDQVRFKALPIRRKETS